MYEPIFLHISQFSSKNENVPLAPLDPRRDFPIIPVTSTNQPLPKIPAAIDSQLDLAARFCATGLYRMCIFLQT